ncbi:Transmembrane component NikQ of energizing module of nickel ECF transporter [Euzebya pacifica]|uniref:Transmembrane component NikQ of energizing module of nickel ECF transporter n=1 Tax=Euzebya pacifica TaxID=1608957 RepID=A0A346Y4G1_9ACTN|nr:cobalt ECF transporter T component CbiQ [Euzebya pacifica]AXV09358.1 Transmembrane component NikQ of energizing module of nickel ECF transporter [Euzebya pacifica]
MAAGHAHALYVHGHSPVHRLAPEVKVAAAFLFVIGVALTPNEGTWAFGVDLVALLVVVRLAELPLRFVASRAMVVLPFIVFAVFIPFIASGDRVEVLGVAVSAEGLAAARAIVAKSVIGASTTVVLAGTTETPAIMAGLARLRVPVVLTTIATFMIRYLEVLTGELGRMRTAMTARGYDPRWLWQVKPIASSAGALFVRSYERGERVHAAMLARGFTGEMPAPSLRHGDTRQWLAVLWLPAVSIAATVGTVTSL